MFSVGIQCYCLNHLVYCCYVLSWQLLLSASSGCEQDVQGTAVGENCHRVWRWCLWCWRLPGGSSRSIRGRSLCQRCCLCSTFGVRLWIWRKAAKHCFLWSDCCCVFWKPNWCPFNHEGELLIDKVWSRLSHYKLAYHSQHPQVCMFTKYVSYSLALLPLAFPKLPKYMHCNSVYNTKSNALVNGYKIII